MFAQKLKMEVKPEKSTKQNENKVFLHTEF